MTKPLVLPDITLIIIDCVAHDLSRLALRDTLSQITPSVVCTYSNEPSALVTKEIVTAKTPRIIGNICQAECVRDVSSILWYEVPRYLNTSHILNIQYDGWVLDASRWENDFLKYDYIGAPWPWHSHNRIGNGGFSLRSARLLQFVRDHMDEFPLLNDSLEDDLLCRKYRQSLESQGFRWAPEKLARKFSFERDDPRKTFGFHGSFNFPHVLSSDLLLKRKSLANDYIRSKRDWRELEVNA